MSSLSRDTHSNPQEFQSFLQFVSHDLRVPLRFMNQIAQRLIDMHEAELPRDVVDGIAAIHAASAEMGELLENLLIFSRLESRVLNRRPVDLEELSRQVFDELEAEIGDRDVTVRIDALPLSRGDSVLLKQVLFNLLSNAVKFTRTRPKAGIRIGSLLNRGELVYYVRDNGVGFEPEKAETLFLPFERLKNATGFEGSGVGLALVNRIIKHHRGHVWAEGRPNEGATFYFSIGKSGNDSEKSR